MEPGRIRSPIKAAILSFFLPGLGQLYNHQRAKAVWFFIGLFFGFMILPILLVLILPVDLEKIQQKVTAGEPPESIDQFFALILIILGYLLILGVWSIVDAARSAKRTRQ